MTGRNVKRVIAVAVAGGVILVLVPKWQVTRERAVHEAPLRALVRSHATKAEVRALLGDPPFIASPEQRQSSGKDLLSSWTMSPGTRGRIDRDLGAHAETWVYGGTYVDFLFFDRDGRIVGFQTIRG